LNKIRKNVRVGGRKGSEYEGIVLYGEKIKKAYLIHRLVAIHFIPNPLNLPEINHIDGNKINNRPNNLEWVNKSENMKHAHAFGLRKYTEKQRLITQEHNKTKKIKKVFQYDSNYELVNEYQSVKQASEITGFGKARIASCSRMEKGYSNINGFIFRYKKL